MLLPHSHHIKAFGIYRWGKALVVNAFENALPDATHLRCFKHFWEIEYKPKSINLESTACEQILADIFGTSGSE